LILAGEREDGTIYKLEIKRLPCSDVTIQLHQKVKGVIDQLHDLENYVKRGNLS